MNMNTLKKESNVRDSLIKKHEKSLRTLASNRKKLARAYKESDDKLLKKMVAIKLQLESLKK